MTPIQIKQLYAAKLQEDITLRRYAGSGAGRQAHDTVVKGRAPGFISATTLSGTVQQLEGHVLVLADSIVAQGMALPLTTADKVILSGRECAIIVPGERNALDGTLIAYDLQVRG